MYYNITFFIICTYWMHHQCYGSENFSNINMLLKVDYFKRFSNQSNIDKLMINSMIGCNCNNYKLNDKITGVTVI